MEGNEIASAFNGVKGFFKSGVVKLPSDQGSRRFLNFDGGEKTACQVVSA